ncbi:SusC/RagA family TonB-linked outer membrane protein [Aureibaculum conchae]|uniref:SusC/RagA family TonB-linked outer membrane protein n=1 Tax=Aureibaculum sp. 2308TA14-22 TaxID=3108392 RepID=UPI00339A2B3E
MIQKFRYLLTLVALLFLQGVIAQTVTGTVSDEAGAPIPGANVIEKGTSNGTTTDFDGKYSIDVSEGATLQFSFVGYSEKEVAVNGQTVINVTLAEGQQLDEVVVTALGIKRAEKTLTYSQQTVGGDDLTKSKDINFVNALSGKAAGVEVRQSSSGPGGSTKIQIRGHKSASGDSSPLFVIDGVPMVNNRGSQPSGWNGVDGGDGLSALNPDDIESMSVLKGANAAILYGSEGANGVVIITTKSGKAGVTTVKVNSSMSVRNIIDSAAPDLQYRYGSDNDSRYSWSNTKGDYDSNFVDDWFETGVDFINSVSISGGNEKTQAYFSYANTSSSGISPKNSYLKNNFAFKASTKFFKDKVKVTSNVILSNENTSNRNRAGYYNNPLTGLYWFPRERNFDDFKNNYSMLDAGRQVEVMNWFVSDHHQSNPYWLLNKEIQEDRFKRAIANLTAEWQITDQLTFQTRFNIDYADKQYDERRQAGGNTTTVAKNGRWIYSDYTDTKTYMDGILSYTNDFGEDFSVNALLGATYQKTNYRDGVSVNSGMQDNGLLYANEFNFNNTGPTVLVASTLGSRVEKNSVFGNIEIGYKDMLFLDFAGRNDWASTLALTGNESYFYNSFGLSSIFSEMFEMPDWISFLKARVSLAELANEVPYDIINPGNTIIGGGSVSPYQGKPFFDAKPEIISTWEIGLDWRMFQGRLGIDFTYYDITSKDQFLRFPIESALYTFEYINAGEITNKGVEITLSGKPIATDDLTWSTGLNYTANKNKIVELSPNALGSSLGGTEGFAAPLLEGGSFGDLWGREFLRDDQGRIMLDPTDGNPLRNEEQVLFGNAEPDFALGWNNTVNYKSWSLNMQINGKFGGVVGSQSEAMLDGFGVSERSAAARDRGFETINAVQNGTAVTQIDPSLYYQEGNGIGGRNGIQEPYVYDRTSVRLGQLSLSYNFNVDKHEWLKNASLSFIGNNLFFFYKDAPFDPELTNSTGRSQPGIENINLPATRTMGLNLSLTF